MMGGEWLGFYFQVRIDESELAQFDLSFWLWRAETNRHAEIRFVQVLIHPI
jgi:hypothetical protein